MFFVIAQSQLAAVGPGGTSVNPRTFSPPSFTNHPLSPYSQPSSIYEDSKSQSPVKIRLNRLSSCFHNHHLPGIYLDQLLRICANAERSRAWVANFEMKHLAAYLLLNIGGNTSPSADDIKGVLESVGIEAEDDRLDKLLEELKGKDLQEV